MVIPVIATLAQAQAHLRLQPAQDGSPSVADVDLQQKLDAATQLVCDYIADRQPPDPAWVAEIESWTLDGSPAVTPPPLVVLAVLEQCADMFRFRGDDPYDARDRGFLCVFVANLLIGYRSPSLA